MTLHDLNKLNIFYVTGRKSFELSGAKDFIINNISRGEILNRFSDFSANPKFDDVKKGVKLFREGNYNCLVAVGGGSVLDMGKLIAFYAENGIDNFHTTIKKGFSVSFPLVAIPTTAGSGSEETHFAVIYNKGVKYSVAHPSLKPTHKIIIPDFAFNCPKEQKLFSALDAFCQSIESYWSRGATKESQKYSLKALKLLKENLEDGLIKNDFIAFKKIVEGSNYAGKAINISKTTACHALSYYFTSKFNIPHGQSVAMIMPYVFDYHYKNMPNSSSMNTLTELLDFETNDFYTEFKKYFKKIGFSYDFSTLGIDLKLNLNDLIKNVNQERLKNNPININFNTLFKR